MLLNTMLYSNRRRWLLLTVVLLTLTSLAWAHRRGDDEVANGDRLRHSDGRSSWQQRGRDNGSRGALEVEEALTELRSIETPESWFKFLKFDKKSGLVGATAYYAKEAFVLLFMSGPGGAGYLDNGLKERKLSEPLARAVGLLEEAARQDNPDAIFLLAEMNFHGNYTHPRNFSEAFRRYEELSTSTGNSSAQYMLGFMYATGIGGVVQKDQTKALIYHTFAARGGNTKSQMTVAYRHHEGIATPHNCTEAAFYYKKVADKAIAYSRTGPPGGLKLPQDAYRIADEYGGVYGEGASAVSSGVYANTGGPNSDQNADIEDVIEYLDLMSRRGDLKATFNLAKMNYDGSRTMKRNMRVARKYFMTVVRKYWSKDNTIILDDLGVTGKLAAKAAAYLGRMHLRGEGTDQSFEKALKWFRLGLKNADSFCQYEMGLMHLNGLGVKKDAVLAAKYFKEAAQQDWPAAQVHLGRLFLDQGELTTAMAYFDLAARHNHIEAIYYLAEINNNGVGRERSCPLATAYYKAVVENVETIHSSWEEANRAYNEGDTASALIGYMMAAEQGYESAQANVAYLLDEHRSVFSLNGLLPWKSETPSLLRDGVLALVYWTRSAKQKNIDSMVKMGDHYLNGYGVEKDAEKAAACYYAAADMMHSAQAKWNLGWMHENGIGVEQDFHLAKRFYDQALETNKESYMPVRLSLLKLRFRSYWNTLTNGKINSIQSDPEPRKHRTWSEWLSNFLDQENEYYHLEDMDDEPLDHYHEPIPGGDEFYYDDVDEGIFESLIIITLAGALALLVYYRQVRQQNHQRAVEEQQRQQLRHGQPQAGGPTTPLLPGQQPDGGFFPPPDDPNFGNWVAGGIGH